ncbi:MAG: hypothetical protein PHV34_22340 [Verrucomicrobiae bacterium]|nr:hypothetical protein [Verrucomicrobiae bacterium]
MKKNEIIFTSDGFNVCYEKRRYELRAIEKPSAGRLKATVKACRAEAGGDGAKVGFHIDTVDFYLSRSRRGFIVEASRFFQINPLQIEKDVARLITQLENYLIKRAQAALPQPPTVSAKDQAEGEKLGHHRDLIGEILRDMEKLGMVGENVNALTAYLAMTSRLMDNPLSLMFLSSSGSGKSFLQDTVLSLCPGDSLVKVASLTDKSLFYKGENALAHKVLALEEDAGGEGAAYSLRILISAKCLVIETTVRNAMTGKLETQSSRVNGPVSVFFTSTNPALDPETRSRFLVLSVDETPAQTKRIIEQQKRAHTLEGITRRKIGEAILSRHHAFQRLLKPLTVVFQDKPLLGFETDRLCFRRDHPKFLQLILAVAFLHQMQRPIKHHPAIGDYVEVMAEDFQTGKRLGMALLGGKEELSAPAQELLTLIENYVRGQKRQRGDVEFCRRELRETIGWRETRLRMYLKELVEMEYVIALGGRQGCLFKYKPVVLTKTSQPSRNFATPFARS